MESFLVKMDIEIAFDSLDHIFLISDFIKNLRTLCSYYHKVFSARKRRLSRQSNFSLFICFSLRDLISAHEIKT